MTAPSSKLCLVGAIIAFAITIFGMLLTWPAHSAELRFTSYGFYSWSVVRGLDDEAEHTPIPSINSFDRPAGPNGCGPGQIHILTRLEAGERRCQ